MILQLLVSSQRSLGVSKNTFLSKDDVSIHPSVILQILMSSQRSFGISENPFWYLKMISSSIHQWYYRWLCHRRGDKWSPDQFIFCWELISAILDFLYQYLHVYYRVLRFWIKIKIYEILNWYVHSTYMETSLEQKTMSDNMTKKTIIALKKSAYLSYHPPLPLH